MREGRSAVMQIPHLFNNWQLSIYVCWFYSGCAPLLLNLNDHCRSFCGCVNVTSADVQGSFFFCFCLISRSNIRSVGCFKVKDTVLHLNYTQFVGNCQIWWTFTDLSLDLHHFCHLAEVHVVGGPVVLNNSEVQGAFHSFVVRICIFKASYHRRRDGRNRCENKKGDFPHRDWLRSKISHVNSRRTSRTTPLPSYVTAMIDTPLSQSESSVQSPDKDASPNGLKYSRSFISLGSNQNSALTQANEVCCV